jgi:acrylyl-CoA reductase (NADPH)
VIPSCAGVNLLGIDSVMCPKPRREQAWARLARDLPLDLLESMIATARLEDLPRLAGEILAGKVRGRVVVNL